MSKPGAGAVHKLGISFELPRREVWQISGGKNSPGRRLLPTSQEMVLGPASLPLLLGGSGLLLSQVNFCCNHSNYKKGMPVLFIP